MTNLIDLHRARLERDRAYGEREYEAGRAFCFDPLDVHENGVSFIDGDHPIAVQHADTLDGICLTRESAEMLIAELKEALASPFAPWKVAAP